MRKLVLTFSVMLLLTVAGIVLFLFLFAPSSPAVEVKIYDGAFALLDSSLDADNNSLWQEHSTDEAGLVALGVDRDWLATLAPGEVAVVELSNVESIVRRSSIDSSRYLFFDLEQSPSEEMEAQFRTPVSLIEGALGKRDGDSDDVAFEYIRSLFQLPISLSDSADLNLSNLSRRDRWQLEGHRIITVDGGIYDGGTLLTKLESTGQYLTIGPLPLTLIESLTNGPLFFAFLGLNVILLSVLCSFAWLWPLYRNVRQLNAAAESFGCGNFSSRVPVSGISPLQDTSIAFNQMGSKIQHLVQSQQHLTNALAHEIRTPLSRIRFRLDALTEHPTPNQVTKRVDELLGDVLELESLAKEMLTHATLNAGGDKLSLTLTDLVPWTRELLRRYATAFPELDCELIENERQGKTMVLLDQRQVDRALGNLLKNALAHANQRISIELIVSTNAINFIVDDDGPGIDLDQRDRVFEPFFRIDKSRNRNTGGFGLGLAIVARICELLGGKCSLAPSTLGGVKFVMMLPRGVPYR